MDEIKGNTKLRRISDIRKLFINNLKKYTYAPNKEIADLLETGSSTVTYASLCHSRAGGNPYLCHCEKLSDVVIS